jgi:hypothetical protein
MIGAPWIATGSDRWADATTRGLAMCEKTDFRAWFDGWRFQKQVSVADDAVSQVMEAAWLARARTMLLPKSIRPTATFTRWLDKQGMVLQSRYRQEANEAWVARGKNRLPFVVALRDEAVSDDQRFEAYVRQFLNLPDDQPLDWTEASVQLAWQIWQQQTSRAAYSAAMV